MNIRLVKYWNGYQEGRILYDVPGGVADLLLSRGIGVEHKEPKTKKKK